MTNKTTTTELSTTAVASNITPAFSREQFETDVAEVFLHTVRSLSWMTDVATAWSVTKAPALESEFHLADPNLKAADLGLTFTQIQQTEFARAMRYLYDLAYNGVLRLGEEMPGPECTYTWITAMLYDIATGAVGSEWNNYGVYSAECASRLLDVAETANARLILEGDDPFYTFSSKGKDGITLTGELRVRDVALLSGMEEMSVRAAANPNRANQLKPKKTDQGTRFDIAVVKEWLIQKKRYIPLTYAGQQNEFDLNKSYKGWTEFSAGIFAQYRKVSEQLGAEALAAKCKEAGFKVSPDSMLDGLTVLDTTMFDDAKDVEKLAEILSLPADLLSWRAKEAMAYQQLMEAEHQIRVLKDRES